jgi:starch-binding outer membrane protein, SusD/RagB family
MKTKIYILALALLGGTACEDKLDVTPHNFSSGEDYYKTEGQMLRAVNGAYSQLQLLYAGNAGEGYSWHSMTEMTSDNTTYQYAAPNRGAQQREEIDEFLINASNNYVQQVWSYLYAGIQQTNIIVDRIEAVPFAKPATKDQYLGEAKFLRALSYFHLVRLFGPVPLRVREVANPEDAFIRERASVDQVYTQILADAEDAVAKLPATYPAADKGRARKGAALTLLGEVYLTRKDYPKAVAALQQVTTLGYSLLPNYADVFDPRNKNNAESVFEMQFNAGIEGEFSSFIYGFGPYNASLGLTGFSGTLQGVNIPTPDLVNAYEPNDEREEASIAYFRDPTNAEYQERFPDGSIPYARKFYHPPFALLNRTDENWPVYRYSYALLLLAEALNEAGQTGEAHPYLNQVRERAGLAPLMGLSQEAFREAVFREQRVEVAFEGHRWFQLLRTGRAVEIMTAHGQQEKQRLSRLSPASYNVQPFKLLFPIPLREVRLNGFEQNPGW